MPITADDILGTAQTSSAQPAKPLTFEDVLGTTPTRPVNGMDPRGEFTPETWPREPIVKPGAGNFGASFFAGLVEDPQAKLTQAAKSLFPNDPKGAQRLGYVGGRMVMANDKGELQYVSSGGTEFGANLAANSPEIALSTLGSFAASPVVGSTLGAIGGRGIKRGFANVVLGEQQDSAANAYDLAKTGAVTAATGLAAKGVAKAADRGRVVDFSPENLQQAQAVQARVKQRFGIDLNLAQASDDPRLLQMWRYVARYPGQSAKVTDLADTLQRGQVDDAVNKFMDLVATGAPSEQLGQAAIDVSKQTIRTARDQLQQKVKPLYDTAYASAPVIDDPAVNKFMSLPYFSQAMASGRRIAALEGRPRPTVTSSSATPQYDSLGMRGADKVETASKQVYSLQDFDYLKQGLDDQIQRLFDAGKRREAAMLTQRKNEFVATLDNISNDTYKQARAAYQSGMRDTVEPLEKGIVGLLAKIDDPAAATAAARVFKDPNITPLQIARAREAILKTPGGEGAWDGLSRQYIASVWNKSNRVAQTGDAINPAGKMQQGLAATPSDMARLKAALGPGKGDVAEELVGTLRKIASTEVRGSDTAFNQEITRVFRGPFARALRLLSPRQTAFEAADEAAVKQMTEKVAEALADPVKVRQLRQVVRMPATTKQVYLLGGLLFGEAAAAKPGDSSFSDQLPSVWQRRPRQSAP